MTTQRIVILILVFCVVATSGVARPFQIAPDEKAFRDIKLLIFDEDWAEALPRLEEFLARYSQSPLMPQAVYYRSKCLAEQGGRDKDALDSYKAFLQLREKNRNLAEDAEVSVIDLALKLYEKGEKSLSAEVENRLAHPNRAIRFYAAIRLSYVKDKRIAVKSVPVLKEIVGEEKNAELRDRAKIALLRVSPDALAGIEDSRTEKKITMLRIEVRDGSAGRIVMSFNIPWALAGLMLNALPDEEKETLRAKGYDVDKILREVQTGRGTILEIVDAKEGKVIKIWID